MYLQCLANLKVHFEVVPWPCVEVQGRAVDLGKHFWLKRGADVGIRVHDLVRIKVTWQNTGHSYLTNHWLSYSTRLFKLSVLFWIDSRFQHSINQPHSSHHGSY